MKNAARGTVFFLMVIVLALPGLLAAENEAPAQPKTEASRNKTDAVPPQPAGPAVNSITQQAVGMGVLSSAGRINQVVNFLTAGNQSGAFLFPVHPLPDQHVFSTSLEVVRPDKSMCYASASFFPNQDAVYDTVEYVDRSPQDMEKIVFKDLKRIGVLKNDIVLLDGGTLKIFLMPAGKGCVVIKKEVVR
ncbi:MAG: hypothetical protein AB1724_00060 [Thermodesulfobacteriota bacterium]